MERIQFASGGRSCAPNGVTPQEMVFDLAVSESLTRRELHLAFFGVGWDCGGGSSTDQVFVEVELFLGNSTMQRMRFAPALSGVTWGDLAVTPEPFCTLPFIVLHSDSSVVSTDPSAIAFESGRSPNLAPNALLWPLNGYASSGALAMSSVAYTFPMEFTGRYDRVEFRTRPAAAQWIPRMAPSAVDPVVFMLGAMVSKAV